MFPKFKAKYSKQTNKSNFKILSIMKKYEVNIDRNASSQNLGTFETLEEAIKLAHETIENTNPENDNEGINIYTEDGMIMSFTKGQEPVKINPSTGLINQ
jgi:hypothetical protein